MQGLEAEIKRLREVKRSRERITFDKLIEAFKAYPKPQQAWIILQREALNCSVEMMEQLGAEEVLAGLLLNELSWVGESELEAAISRCYVLAATFWLWFLTNCDGCQAKFNDRRIALGQAIVALSKYTNQK